MGPSGPFLLVWGPAGWQQGAGWKLRADWGSYGMGEQQASLGIILTPLISTANGQSP